MEVRGQLKDLELYPQGKNLLQPVKGILGGFHNQLWQYGIEHNLLSMLGIKLWFLGHAAHNLVIISTALS